MTFAMAFALAASVLEPSSVAGMDWNDRDSLMGLHELLDSQAENCRGLGFTRKLGSAADTMAGKIEGHLLLNEAPAKVLKAWQGILTDLEDDPPSETDDRMFNAALAAVRDPDLYEQAEAAYVAAFIADDERTLAACESGAEDQFISNHYWSGTGSARGRERRAMEVFKGLVGEMRANGR